jgi:hypothetical protein
MILTMTLVMIVVMIESTGMFLALSDITGKKIGQPELAAGLRTDGLGTADRRHLQHLPLHQLQPERGPGRRDRREEPLGLRGRRHHHDRARHAAQDGGLRRVDPAPSCSAARGW